MLLLARAPWPHPDVSALVVAAADGVDPSAIPGQFGVAGAVVVPLIGALTWYVRRSESRAEAALARAEARADRYETRLTELQERVIPLLNSNAETNREVVQAARDLMQVARDLERGRT